MPRTHGSALFTRGETQALVVTTLGTGEDEQWIDALQGTYKEHFLLHYNFPPYSVGETGRLGGTKRREIGHGKLAWRAIHPVLPAKHDFPYTIRVVSEVTESNGSSSMATVCGTSLALMDAGVPLKRPTAGIAMGLILEGEKFAVLSDILGDEDHLGDMDFKVAGTEQGITSLQMDIKIAGITEQIMKIALGQAKDGRIHILGEMAKALTAARAELGEHAPRIETLKIPTDKIREVIGTGGKVIREIVEKTGAKINVEDDGTVKVASANGEFDPRGDQVDQVDRFRSGSRRDLRRHRREGHGFRRLRELLRFQGWPRSHQPARPGPRAEDLRRRQGRRQGEGEAARLRRSRQGAAVDEGGRSGNRRGPGSQAEGRRRRTAAGRRRGVTFSHHRRAALKTRDPVIHRMEKGWIAGSSPAMTNARLANFTTCVDDLAERPEIARARRGLAPAEPDGAERLGLARSAAASRARRALPPAPRFPGSA